MIEIAKKFSIDTWEKITSLLPHSHSFREEGMTDELISKIILNPNNKSLLILDESINLPEKKTGADFFWKIGSNSSSRKLSVQAKRVSLSSDRKRIVYSSFRGKEQLKTLLNFSEVISYEPFYLFYNGNYQGIINDPFGNIYAHTDVEYHHGPKDLPLLGCTISPLQTISSILNSYTEPTFQTVNSEHSTITLQQFFRNSNLRMKMNPFFPTGGTPSYKEALELGSDNYFKIFQNDNLKIIVSSESEISENVIRNATESYSKMKTKVNDYKLPPFIFTEK